VSGLKGAKHIKHNPKRSKDPVDDSNGDGADLDGDSTGTAAWRPWFWAKKIEAGVAVGCPQR